MFKIKIKFLKIYLQCINKLKFIKKCLHRKLNSLIMIINQIIINNMNIKTITKMNNMKLAIIKIIIWKTTIRGLMILTEKSNKQFKIQK